MNSTDRVALVLRVPRASPSLNDFANRRSRFPYVNLARAWRQEIRDALLDARVAARVPLGWPRPPTMRVVVTITRFAPEHQWLDPDNLAGGMKPILDALRKFEVLADDDHASIELVTRQEVSPYRQPVRWTEIALWLRPPDPTWGHE